LAGGSNGFTLTGSTSATAGADTLIGSDQNDIINGGNATQTNAAAKDTLTGNDGNDTFVFDVTVSAAATLTVATTTAGIDREMIDLADGGSESVSITYSVNGVVDGVVVSLAGDVTDQNYIASTIAAALDAKAGISASVDVNDDIIVAGDNASSLTITDVTWSNFTTETDDNFVDGTDVAQVSTLTVSGTPTAGDVYSAIASLVAGGGISTDNTGQGTWTADATATALEANFADGAVVATVFGSVITFTDNQDNDGGFTLSTDTTAAFGGSGASDTLTGAGDLAKADLITDFNMSEDTISFGLAAGSVTNYIEAATAADYATAYANANTAFDGSIQYYLTASTADAVGLLFVDANLDGSADLVVQMTGVSQANFTAANIIA